MLTGLAKVAADARVCSRKMSTMAETFYNPEQKELMETTRKVIEAEVNPYVDEWEAAKAFPAHKVFKVKRMSQIQCFGYHIKYPPMCDI